MSQDEGRLLRAFAGGRTVRVLAVEARAAAEATRKAHGLGPVATRLAAEGVVATALLSAHVKGDERIMLQVQGERPRYAFLGEIDAEGAVRARLTPNELTRAPDRVTGVLLAIKADARKELYRGTTAIDDQTLEQALASHLGTSTQVDALLRIGVTLGEGGVVGFAGGLLVERLPEHPEHPWIDHETFLARFGGLAEAPVEEILTELALGSLAGTEVEPLEARPVIWRCRCSQQKVEATLGSLGAKALREMLEEDGGAELVCHFCNRAWQIPAERLRELIALNDEAGSG